MYDISNGSFLNKFNSIIKFNLILTLTEIIYFLTFTKRIY